MGKYTCYLNDAWVSWLKGEKFPVAFYGDSTIDGNTTTGWVRNVLGTDSINPGAFSKRLEDKLRKATGNEVLRIYNAGFSGTTSNWAVDNFENEFTGNSAYCDVKMIGIGFGINDRLLYKDLKSYKEGFKSNINKIIDLCFLHGIQPFLLTTQAIVEPGVTTTYINQYPLRTTVNVKTVANQVKAELAYERRLELIDVNTYTEDFLLYSEYNLNTIIPDKLHFSDVGHEYEADIIFSYINSQTIHVNKPCRIDYSCQRIVKSVPDDWLTLTSTLNDPFKVYTNRTKTDNDDINIMSVYIFNHSERQLFIKAYKCQNDSKTYIKLDGKTIHMTELKNHLGRLELGLHKLEVFSGHSQIVDFKGFIVE